MIDTKRRTSRYWLHKQAERRKYERFRDLIRRRREWRALTPEQKEKSKEFSAWLKVWWGSLIEPFPHKPLAESNGKPVEWRRWNELGEGKDG